MCVCLSLRSLTKAAKPLTTVVMISAEEAVLIQRSRTRQATLLSALGDVNNGAEPHLESLVIGLGGLAAQNYTPDFKAKRISLTPNVQLKGRDAFITNIELARAYLLEVQNEYQVTLMCLYLTFFHLPCCV